MAVTKYTATYNPRPTAWWKYSSVPISGSNIMSGILGDEAIVSGTTLGGNSGTVWNCMSVVSGVEGNAIYFVQKPKPSCKVIIYPQGHNVDIYNTNFTWATWLKLGEPGVATISGQYVLYKVGNGPNQVLGGNLGNLDYGYALKIREDSCPQFIVYSGTKSGTVTGLPLKTNVWYHIGVSGDRNTQMQMYISGIVSGAPYPLSGTFGVMSGMSINTPLIMGNMNYKHEELPFYGTLDDTRFYSGIAMTGGEMRALALGRSGKFAILSGSPASVLEQLWKEGVKGESRIVTASKGGAKDILVMYRL